jgi:hypothetical protein
MYVCMYRQTKSGHIEKQMAQLINKYTDTHTYIDRHTPIYIYMINNGHIDKQMDKLMNT